MTTANDNWDEHWKRYAEANAANPAQVYRRRLVFELLGLTESARLLEIGSGSGEFAKEVLRRYPRVELLGLDASKAGVARARREVLGTSSFMEHDITRPPPRRWREGWATHAVCSEVLEHLDDPVAALQNVRPLFAPGCKLVVTVPGGPMSAFDKSIGHRRHFTRKGLAMILREAGLRVESVYGAGFPFFNLYRLAVVLAGDAVAKTAETPSFASRAAMQVFSGLFKMNLRGTRFGWQLAAVAVEP